MLKMTNKMSFFNEDSKLGDLQNADNEVTAALVSVDERYNLRDKLMSTNLLTEEEIHLITSLRYAGSVMEERGLGGNIFEEHKYRVEIALYAAYLSHFNGKVMTDKDYEEHYSKYSEKDFMTLREHEIKIYKDFGPLVEGIVELHNKLAEVNKPKDSISLEVKE